LLEQQGLAPGTLAELIAATGSDPSVAKKALGRLVAAGTVVRLGPDLHFSAAAVAGARDLIVAYLGEHGTMLASDARDLLGTSRKYVVPLLEYFDKQGLTVRQGDARVLRG
jgi:selenocysteine-specific elongation factor